MDMNHNLKVLVLVDVQRDFIDVSLANPDAQACIPDIVDKVDNFDGDIIFLTMDTHGEDYLDTPEGKMLPVKHCVYNTLGWKIDDKVQTVLKRKMENGMRVVFVPKNTFGSIYADKLIPTYDYLGSHMIHKSLVDCIDTLHTMEGKNIDIECCGFCTDICVVSNVLALKAAAYDYAEITVDSKCCAGVTPEKHKAALEVMKSCQIKVI
jgi:nicotinamidase-related amidase